MRTIEERIKNININEERGELLAFRVQHAKKYEMDFFNDCYFEYEPEFLATTL